MGVPLVPDWAREVLSPTTAELDREKKMRAYAREGMRHLWLVDPLRRELEVYGLEDSCWERLGTHSGQDRVHAEPFTPLLLELGLLWER
jgi:Uma2 family endonuclease